LDKAFDHGFREITMKSKPINTPDDLKGIKIHLPVAPLFIALFQHLGAIAEPDQFRRGCTAHCKADWSTGRRTH
jgi:TRAP-type C4-dicarboxylate transport system substrate-binding protein